MSRIRDTDSVRFAKALSVKGHGYPLWTPEPPDDLPIDYKEEGVRIGDVGVMRSNGSFDFIFNICVPGNHPINRFGVPNGFEQLEIDHSREVYMNENQFSPGADVSSTSIRKTSLELGFSGDGLAALVPASMGAGIQITSSSREGAVLLLPQGASRTDTRKIPRFARYAIKHGLEWYRFVNEEDLGLENGSLYLVTGCDKASAWGVASFYNASTEGEISLKLTAAQVASGRVSRAWQWETYSPASVRSGPFRTEGEEEWGKNQCVFLRGLKVAISDGLWTWKTGVKVSPMKGTPPNSSSPTSKSGFTPFLGDGTRLPFFRRQDSEGRDRCKDDPDGQLPSSSGESSDDALSDDVELECVPEVAGEPWHPSTLIHRFLFEKMTDADIAVCHDDDWRNILHNNDKTFPSDAELLRRIEANYFVFKDDGGAYLFLRPPELNPESSLQTEAKFTTEEKGKASTNDNRRSDLPEPQILPQVTIQEGTPWTIVEAVRKPSAEEEQIYLDDISKKSSTDVDDHMSTPDTQKLHALITDSTIRMPDVPHSLQDASKTSAYRIQLHEYLARTGRGKLTWQKSSTGPDQCPTWTATALIGEQKYGTGQGLTVKAAMNIAAQRAMARLTEEQLS